MTVESPTLISAYHREIERYYHEAFIPENPDDVAAFAQTTVPRFHTDWITVIKADYHPTGKINRHIPKLKPNQLMIGSIKTPMKHVVIALKPHRNVSTSSNPIQLIPNPNFVNTPAALRLTKAAIRVETRNAGRETVSTPEHWARFNRAKSLMLMLAKQKGINLPVNQASVFTISYPSQECVVGDLTPMGISGIVYKRLTVLQQPPGRTFPYITMDMLAQVYDDIRKHHPDLLKRLQSIATKALQSSWAYT